MEHGFLALIETMASPWRIARRLERRLSAPWVDAEVAVSSSMRRRVLQAPHARRVELIENGIDLTRFKAMESPHRDGCLFACASRLVPGKGLRELVDAFARVASRDADVRLVIAGDGPERADVEALIARHGIAEHVEMVGVVHDMPSFWSRADVAVMPSTAPESFGMVALEAMAAGRPVVATRNGGADGVVLDGVTGRLVRCGDASALADAMLAYAFDPAVRRAHAGAGRARCESLFTIERTAARYARLLAELGGRPTHAQVPAEPALEEVNA
jgi:glycosyltransferase involved in cell wall biosynthesis